MSTKLHRAVLSVLLAASVAVVLAPPAEARRNTPPTSQPGYVPPYGQDPEVDAVPDPYAPVVNPDTPVAPTVVPVDLDGPPTATDPGTDVAGDGENLGPAPTDTATVLAGTQTRPEVQSPKGGVFANTGAETLPLARAGLAAFALGFGLIMLGRRRSALPTV